MAVHPVLSPPARVGGIANLILTIGGILTSSRVECGTLAIRSISSGGGGGLTHMPLPGAGVISGGSSSSSSGRITARPGGVVPRAAPLGRRECCLETIDECPGLICFVSIAAGFLISLEVSGLQ